jgi:restriction endonuclease
MPMGNKATTWQDYEQVARYLLNQIKDRFGLVRVEGKQTVRGRRSGTDWELDAKGVGSVDGKFLIVECRRYTSSRQNQGRVGSLAWAILDTGAAGGIIVSPLGLQEGAEKVARAGNIHSVRLNANCTTSDYILQFLNELHVGFSETLRLKTSLTMALVDANGNVVETRICEDEG